MLKARDALGEHPAVEVGRDVVADVHLGQVHVVRHLVVGDADALLRTRGEHGPAQYSALRHSADNTDASSITACRLVLGIHGFAK